MADNEPDAFDTDTLPPTQYLILEVLAARHRTGERLWTFPAKLRHHLNVLADRGLIGWKSGITYGTVRAWFTDAGRAAALLATYKTPADRAADAVDAAMHSVWLHGDWRYLTKKMTTEEREAAADAVQRYHLELNAYDGTEEPLPLSDEDLRWWRQ